MKARHRRAIYIGILLLGVGLAAVLALTAFQQNLLYFYSPSQIRAGEAPADARFRIGGLVEEGSVQRAADSLEIRFVLADCEHSVPVRYMGILPDLFREGQGIVAYGRLGPNGAFVADEVLAKHDENYMPREVADSLQQEGGQSCMPTGMGRP